MVIPRVRDFISTLIIVIIVIRVIDPRISRYLLLLISPFFFQEPNWLLQTLIGIFFCDLVIESRRQLFLGLEASNNFSNSCFALKLDANRHIFLAFLLWISKLVFNLRLIWAVTFLTRGFSFLRIYSIYIELLLADIVTTSGSPTIKIFICPNLLSSSINGHWLRDFWIIVGSLVIVATCL